MRRILIDDSIRAIAENTKYNWIKEKESTILHVKI